VADMTEVALPQTVAASTNPAVSVCIPTFNGVSWIRAAIESALAQDFSDLEVVVCDDASADDTVNVARQIDDERVRVIANPERVGLARNWNRCVSASNGTYIKFLMQDDRLAPDCVGRMVELLKEDPEVGLVFCPRNLELDEPGDPLAIDFAERFSEPHARLGPIERLNAGRTLFAVMQRDRFRDNLIGEPTVVMVRRQALVSLGLFNVRLQQLTDLEMWLRISYFFRVGFISEPLATFRVHSRSASASNRRSGSGWLDRVWLLEGLRTHLEIRRRLSSRAGMRVWLLTYANAGRRLVADGPRAIGPHLVELGHYLKFRLRRRSGDVLHEPLAR
jgi:glycosyltransferase involved in cell wall biosynthesis